MFEKIPDVVGVVGGGVGKQVILGLHQFMFYKFPTGTELGNIQKTFCPIQLISKPCVCAINKLEECLKCCKHCAPYLPVRVYLVPSAV